MSSNRDPTSPDGSASSDESLEHPKAPSRKLSPTPRTIIPADEQRPPLSPPLPPWPSNPDPPASSSRAHPARVYSSRPSLIEIRSIPPVLTPTGPYHVEHRRTARRRATPPPQSPSPFPSPATVRPANRQATAAIIRTGRSLPSRHSNRRIDRDAATITSARQRLRIPRLPPPPNVEDPVARRLVDPSAHLRRLAARPWHDFASRSQRRSVALSEAESRAPPRPQTRRRMSSPGPEALAERMSEDQSLLSSDGLTVLDEEIAIATTERRDPYCRPHLCCFFTVDHQDCVPPLAETALQTAIRNFELLGKAGLSQSAPSVLDAEVQALVDTFCQSTLGSMRKKTN